LGIEGMKIKNKKHLNLKQKTQKIKEFAKQIGFDDVGIVKVDFLHTEKEHLQEWIDKGYNAEMSYMNRNFEKRLNPNLLVENAKSIIVVIKNYYPDKQQAKDTYQVSKYAYFPDYHYLIKDDLKKILEFINTEIEPVKGRYFVDSAPVLEKIWAQKAGLGWIGKNSLLLTKKGSYFFIGEIICDIELSYDETDFKNFCGTCSKCIDACPTNAIVEPYVIDANKCISYQTIEKKGEFNDDLNLNFKNYIFGCDICQDVCPWNNKAVPTNDNRFDPNFLLLSLKCDDWENLSQQDFNKIFRKTPLERVKYTGLMRNIKYVVDYNKKNEKK